MVRLKQRPQLLATFLEELLLLGGVRPAYSEVRTISSELAGNVRRRAGLEWERAAEAEQSDQSKSEGGRD